MERMPIYNRLIFNKYPHAGPLYYRVLAPISRSYPPVEGRLHTCYSPVRRSPPEVLLPHVLPLDLHVLGLSLAFILSQDQTLRCKIVFLISVKLSLKTATIYRPRKINAHQNTKSSKKEVDMIPSIKLPDSRFIVFFLSDTIFLK